MVSINQSLLQHSSYVIRNIWVSCEGRYNKGIGVWYLITWKHDKVYCTSAPEIWWWRTIRILKQQSICYYQHQLQFYEALRPWNFETLMADIEKLTELYWLGTLILVIQHLSCRMNTTNLILSPPVLKPWKIHGVKIYLKTITAAAYRTSNDTINCTL